MSAPTFVAHRENTYLGIRNTKIIQFLQGKTFALQSYWDDISLESIISHESGNSEKVQSVIIISTIVVNGIWSQIFPSSHYLPWLGVWRIFYLGVRMFPLVCKNVKIPHWEYNSFVWDWDGLSTPDIQMIKLSTLTTQLSTKLKNVGMGILLLWLLCVLREGTRSTASKVTCWFQSLYFFSLPIRKQLKTNPILVTEWVTDKTITKEEMHPH